MMDTGALIIVALATGFLVGLFVGCVLVLSLKPSGVMPAQATRVNATRVNAPHAAPPPI